MHVIEKVKEFYRSFKGKKGIIGKSLFGEDVYYFEVKKSEYPVVIAQYSMHAREYITAYLALKQIEGFIKDGKTGRVLFIPLVNPDGVRICLNQDPFYKANGRGVDLNVNFPARWGKGDKNSLKPGAENYIGAYPLSEPESFSLAKFTLDKKADGTISYHSKGEEIYWEFFTPESARVRDKRIADAVGKVTGYRVREIEGSCGGYKDWCVETLKIPALTIEVGSDALSHPIGEENLKEIFDRNERVIEVFTEKLYAEQVHGEGDKRGAEGGERR